MQGKFTIYTQTVDSHKLELVVTLIHDLLVLVLLLPLELDDHIFPGGTKIGSCCLDGVEEVGRATLSLLQHILVHASHDFDDKLLERFGFVDELRIEGCKVRVVCNLRVIGHFFQLSI